MTYREDCWCLCCEGRESSEGRTNTDCGETSSYSGTCGETWAAPLSTALQQGEASLPSALRWPLLLTIRQRLTVGLSKSLVAGNNPDVLLVPKCHWFYEILYSTFSFSPMCDYKINVLVNQSADCNCTWMPKCKCSVCCRCWVWVWGSGTKTSHFKHLWESC